MLPLPPSAASSSTLLTPSSTRPAPGQSVTASKGIPLLCSVLQVKRHLADIALTTDSSSVPHSQGSDSGWLLPAIHHIANVIGEERKDKIKEHIKEMCQDYPDIRYMKWQMSELLSSIPNSATLCYALAKLQLLFSAGSHTSEVRVPATGQIPPYFSFFMAACFFFFLVCWIVECTQVTSKAFSFYNG